MEFITSRSALEEMLKAAFQAEERIDNRRKLGNQE